MTDITALTVAELGAALAESARFARRCGLTRPPVANRPRPAA